MLALTDIGPALAAASISLILSVDFAVEQLARQSLRELV
jgi:hypothetical protein